MTVRVTTLKGCDAGAYYVEQLPNYYLQSGEPRGTWLGDGAPVLGLSGEVDDDAFLALPRPTDRSPTMIRTITVGRHRTALQHGSDPTLRVRGQPALRCVRADVGVEVVSQVGIYDGDHGRHVALLRQLPELACG